MTDRKASEVLEVPEWVKPYLPDTLRKAKRTDRFTAGQVVAMIVGVLNRYA